MIGDWLELAPAAVTYIAILRVAWVLMGLVRTFLNRGRRVRFQLSAVEVVTLPEPLVLAAGVVLAGAFGRVDGAGGPVAVLGLGASLAGLAISFAAFVSFPTVGTGHYVDAGQRVVRRGIYGWVRHPIYLGALLIWSGFALGCRSVAAGVVMLVYVIPAYVLYTRAEEQMMSAHFGDEYRRYCADVGGLWPRPSALRR